MLSPQELRKIAREKKLALDLVEKDYVLGWILYGIYSSRLSNCLAFKGGTALSKVYFPSDWRLSEDLYFTILGENSIEDLVTIKRWNTKRKTLKMTSILMMLSLGTYGFLTPLQCFRMVSLSSMDICYGIVHSKGGMVLQAKHFFADK